MSVLDIIIILPIVWGIWEGLRKGLIKLLASIVALLLGIWGAIKFSNLTADFLTKQFGLQSEYTSIIAFAITFILIVIGIHLLAFLIDKLIKAVALGFVLRFTGAIVGAFKYALIISVFLALFNFFNNTFHYVSEEDLNKSILYKPVSAIAPAIFPYLKFAFDQIK